MKLLVDTGATTTQLEEVALENIAKYLGTERNRLSSGQVINSKSYEVEIELDA